MKSNTQPTTECISAFKNATAPLVYITHESKIMEDEFAPELARKGEALLKWLHDANVRLIVNRGRHGFISPEGYEFVCYRYHGECLDKPIFMIELKAKQ